MPLQKDLAQLLYHNKLKWNDVLLLSAKYSSSMLNKKQNKTIHKYSDWVFVRDVVIPTYFLLILILSHISRR